MPRTSTKPRESSSERALSPQGVALLTPSISAKVTRLARHKPWLFMALGVVLFYSSWLTNEGTPPGDGYRILPQVDFIENSGTWLPFWDYERVGGVPTFADPERFIWLSWLIDANAATSNLQLNLIFVLAALLNAFGSYFLGRQLKLSPYFSAMAAVALVTSQATLDQVMFGRINFLMIHGLGFVGLGCLVSSIRAGFAPALFVISAVSVAVAIAGSGQYALVFPLLPMFAVSWAVYREQHRGPTHALALAFAITAAVGFSGLLLAGPWILPLVLAHLEAGFSSTLDLAWNFPRPLSLPGLIIPLTLDPRVAITQNVPMVAPAVGLGILIALMRPRVTSPSPYALAFVALALSCVGFFVLGAFEPLREIAAQIPVLAGIRQSMAFSRLFTIAVVYAAALLTCSLCEPSDSGTHPDYLILASIVVMTTAVYAANADFILHADSPLTFAAIPYAALVVTIAWVGSAKLKYEGRVLFGILVAAGVIANFPGAAVPPLQSNAMSPSVFAEAFKADTGYYKIFCYRSLDIRSCKVPGARLENVGGFSLYFLPTHRHFLELITGREVSEQRPHWVRGVDCTDLDPVLLTLGNIKYVLCKQRDELSEPANLVATHHTRQLLEREQWQSALRIYNASVPEQAVDKGDLAAMRAQIADALAKDAVIIDAGGISDAASPKSAPHQSVRIERLSANKLHLTVETDQPGILVIPEYWAPGWSVELNGQKAPLRRAFFMYRAVEVPAGKSAVVFAYRPPGMTLGFIVCATILMLIAIAGYSKPLWGSLRR